MTHHPSLIQKLASARIAEMRQFETRTARPRRPHRSL